MKKFIKTYENRNANKINRTLIDKGYDDSIVNYIVDCCKSLEVLDYIKFVGYTYEEDESKIDTSEYISSKARTKSKNPNITRYRYPDDSRYAEMKLYFHLNCNGETDTIVKKILIPVHDKDNYYLIKGNKYFLMYQVVDNSTYTTKRNLTLKSMMPVALAVNKTKITDIDGNEYNLPVYYINLFKKEINIMLFYLAKYGFQKTLEYLSLNWLVNITTTSMNASDDVIVFPINSKLFLEVNKRFFEKYQYTRSMVAMLLMSMNNRSNEENIYDVDHWVFVLGSVGTTNKNNQYDKGLNTLTYFGRMLDDTTKRVLKVHPIHKHDIYSILRWMMMHFDELKKKDNLDLNNKRLRCNEYIAALLTTNFSERINRVIALGKKATMNKVKDIFKFPGDILISQLHKSGLLKFDDRVNDLDFFGKLRITMKGPNSLGGNNENNISAKYRGINPSYIGKIDINVCGTSDPGTGALLTPMCETHGLYFNDEHEPETFKYVFDKDIYESIIKQAYEIFITGSFESAKSYFDYHVGLSKKIDVDAPADDIINNIHLIEVSSTLSYDADETDEDIIINDDDYTDD